MTNLPSKQLDPVKDYEELRRRHVRDCGYCSTLNGNIDRLRYKRIADHDKDKEWREGIEEHENRIRDHLQDWWDSLQ